MAEPQGIDAIQDRETGVSPRTVPLILTA
jgi:hypothetical protein